MVSVLRVWFMGILCVFLGSLPTAALAQDEGEAGEAAEAEAAEAGDEAGDEAEPEVVYETPERVKIGVHLSDIQTVDLMTHSYAMDFYVWFLWKNPDLDPASTMEIANPIEQWGLMVTPIYEEAEELPDGSLYQVLRVQGTFSKKMPLFNYPFDRQVLELLMEDAQHDEGAVVYEVDPQSPTVSPSVQLPGYRIGEITLTVEPWKYPTAFGDPRAASGASYSRATLRVPLSRPPVAYSIKLLLPVLAVILCAGLMFLLPPGMADARVGVGITALLTIVALQMTFSADLPEVGYLMLMDKVYLLAYTFVILGLGVVVRTTKMAGAGEVEVAWALQHKLFVVLLALWGGALAALVGVARRAG